MPASRPVAQRAKFARGAWRSICWISACSPRCGCGAPAGSSPWLASCLAALVAEVVLLGGCREDGVLLVDEQQGAGPEVVEQRRLGGERAVARRRG